MTTGRAGSDEGRVPGGTAECGQTARLARIGFLETDVRSGRVRVSSEMPRIHGLEHEQFPVSRAGFLALLHHDDRVRVADAIDDLIASGGAERTVAFRRVWPDGSVHWIESTLFLQRDSGDRAPRLLLGAIDVTEHKLLHQKFLHAQKMEAVGRLASGIAHDFNNLLTVILSHGESLATQLRPQSVQHQQALDMMQAAERAAALTRQLMTFSRKPIAPLAPPDLNRAVSTVVTMLCRVIGEDVILSTVLAPDVGEVIADQAQIEHILMNLAINARDAMPAGGTLTIQTEVVTLADPRA